MRQVHAVKAKTPVARAIEALVRIQVHTAVLSEAAARKLPPAQIVALAVAVYDQTEEAIRVLKGRH